MVQRPLPADVYLETSIVVSATIAGLAHSTPSQQFCEALGTFGARIYFSTLLHLEFANAMRKLARPRRRQPPRLPPATWQQFHLDRWATDEPVRHEWLRFGREQLEAFLAQFVEAVELPVRPGTWAQAATLMGQYDWKSYDAAHVATATENGLRDFATADREFEPLQGVQLWLARDDRPALV